MTTRLDVLPNPAFMEWQDWADTVVGFNRLLRNTISSDLPWPEFAQRLTQVVPETPNHEMFESWQAWANGLRRALAF